MVWNSSLFICYCLCKKVHKAELLVCFQGRVGLGVTNQQLPLVFIFALVNNPGQENLWLDFPNLLKTEPRSSEGVSNQCHQKHVGFQFHLVKMLLSYSCSLNKTLFELVQAYRMSAFDWSATDSSNRHEGPHLTVVCGSGLGKTLPHTRRCLRHRGWLQSWLG